MIGALLAVLLVSPHPVATIPTGQAPCGAAASFGAVWVANDGAGTLAHVDPRTNRVTRRIAVGAGACSVAAGAGALWVVNYKASTLVRVDPHTARTRSVRVGAVPFDVLVAFGRVWVTAWEDGILDEVDPQTLAVLRRIQVGPRPMGLAVRLGAVWVGFGREATAIARVDPATGAVARFGVGATRPGWFAAGTADFWIQAADSDLLHVDPRTGEVRQRLTSAERSARVRSHPTALSGCRTRRRASSTGRPVGGRVIDSFSAGPGAYLVLRAFRSMWVLSYAGSDVRRFRGS